MTLDPLILSRLQFFWVIAWHILLPAFTIGLASYIALMEGMHMLTGREIYFRISSFWIKIFSVAFGMGVVSGIVMPFQFGTNWSRYSADTANVLAPLFAYEGIVAFFLEAAFLGVLLFGRNLVPRWAHFLAAVLIASGTLFSAFWILSANSWMQTPAGYKIIDGKFYPVDWLAIVFNPSFPYRFFHMVCAAYITTGFVVLSVGAWLIRRGRFVLEGRLMFSGTLWLLLVLVPLQIFLGDQHGLNTLQHQPAKLAAIEGDFTTESPTPLHLFAIPDQKRGIDRYDVAIPYLGSIIITHTLTKPVVGLDHWPRTDWPPVIFPFFAFRIMVGMAVADAAAGRGRQSDAARRNAVPQPVAAAALSIRGADRLHRGHRRLDHDGDRAATLDRLWIAADGGFGLAFADRMERAGELHRLCGRLCRYLPVRLAGDVAHRASRAGGDGAGGRGGGERPAGASRRPPAGLTRRGSSPMNPALALGVGFDFVPIWTAILGIGVFFYVMLDGFDLGVGILYGLAPDTASRNLVMNAIAPIWDGNETWLVLGGMGLLAAFPIAFAIIIPAVYFPILVMLLSLIFRGVAFEFRYRDAAHRTFWDYGFSYGSMLATFAQGIVLGAFIQGFQTDGLVFTGGSLDCFTPFSIVTGICLVFGYSLLGAGWLVLKTEGALQDWARRHGRDRLHRRLCGRAGGEHLDAARASRHRRPLVRLAQQRAAGAGADRDRAGRLGGVARAEPAAGGVAALRFCHLAVRALLSRHRHQPLALRGAAPADVVAGGILAGDAGVPADRHVGAAAGDPDVHELLGTGCSGGRCGRISGIIELRVSWTDDKIARAVSRRRR